RGRSPIPGRAAASAKTRSRRRRQRTPTSCICCPRLEVERLCDSRLDPPLDASSTAQPSADSATASTAALLNRRRRLVRADSLILRDPQARHAIDMLAAAGLAAAPPPPSPPPISSEEAARLRDLLSVPAHTADPRVPLLLGATSAEDCRRLLLSSAAATALLAGFDTVSDAALRSLAHALDLFLSQVCQRIADQPSVSDYPDGLHKALADFGITEAWQLRRCYDRLITGGRRRAQDRLAALLAQLAPATPSAVSAAPEAVATAEVKAEPEDSAAGQGL
uniref:BTP domain-containing protein n=1 Tax=Macrostomum lignano TaxID=282301 RepID=A0A1I8H464_9PLAT